MNVRSMRSNCGREVANQFIIETPEARYFQSYRSIIVKIDNQTGKVTLGKDWDYSKTTGKYRNKFLGETKKETERKIKEGIYTVDENL